MKKLILTSTGLHNPKIADKFLKYLNKPVSQAKILFIPTAARLKEELDYAKNSQNELYNLGITPNNLTVFTIDRTISYNNIKSYDVMYICGGNTFYLLAQIRKYKFDKIIDQFINKGKLYVGVSAGSIIVGPSIEIAVPFDKNDSNIADFTGLNIINKVISPHYTEKEEELIKKYKNKFTLFHLTDNQALLIIDRKETIIE